MRPGLQSLVLGVALIACGAPQQRHSNEPQSTQTSSQHPSAAPSGRPSSVAPSRDEVGAEAEMRACIESRGREWALACLVGSMLQVGLHGAEIGYVDPNTMTLRTPGHQFQLNLENLRADIARAPDQQAAMQVIAHWLSVVAQSAQAASPASTRPVSADQLLVVVRSREFVGRIDPALIVTEPYVGDLVRLYVADEPDTINYLRPEQATALHMDMAALRTRALANLSQRSGAIAHLRPTVRGTIGQLALGDGYDADRIQLHDAWATLGAGGHLLVAIPCRDLLLYSTRDDATAFMAMSAMAMQRFQSDGHPVTHQIFRWTPSGWDPVTAPIGAARH